MNVATDGDDAAVGSATAPFKTVARAVKALRDLRAERPDEPVEIVIGAGFYELDETLALTAADTTAPVTFVGAGRDRTVLSGGRRLALKPQPKGGVWGTYLPEVKSGAWKIEQLYVNGRRALRPTLPRGGYYQPADRWPDEKGKAQADRFVAAEGQLSADWPGLTNEVEVVLMHGWNISRLRVKSYDPATRRVMLNGGRGGYMRNIDKKLRFRLENVAAAFGEKAGEWYCNAKTGWVYYRPLPGETPEKTEIVAPRLSALMTVCGEADKPVAGVTVRDLTLAHQSETLAPGGTTYSQTSPNAGGALVVRYGRNIRVERVAVSRTGGWGVKFCEGCADCTLTKSLLYDVGVGGALVGLDRRQQVKRGTALWSHGCEISECEVFGYGRVHPGGVGVNLLMAGDCRVLRNVIHDGYYSGVNTGYEWSFGGDGATGNRIADNHIYDIGKGVLSDMAGIYTLGEHAGSVLSGNCIHDVTRAHYGAQGFYFDQGSANLLVCSNVVYRTHDATYNVGVPNRNIRGENNLFGFSSNYFLTSPAMKDRPKKSWSNVCERCVMLYDDGMKSRFPTDRGPMDNENSVYTNNVWIKSGLRHATPAAMMAAASTAEATALGFHPFALKVREAEGLPAITDTFPPQQPGETSAEPLTVKAGLALDVREPVRTVPHELDALVGGGHVQGIACSEEGVYLSHSLGVEMVGWDGKFIRHVKAPFHLGDTAFSDGHLYGAFCLGKKELIDGKPGLVRVWDAQLKTLAERSFDVPLDGITVLNGKVYVGVGTADGAWHRGCRIKVLDLELNELEEVAVDFGYDIAYGVQTMSTVGNEIICGCYGGTSIGSADLKTWRRVGLNCGEGVDRVPCAVAGTDQPLYVVEKSENGGMRQWRKDPTNTPPVVRLDFFVYTNGNFRSLSGGLSKGTRVSGELRARLGRNFDRMEEAKYRPENVYLTMKQSGDWPGDTEGRTILALVCDARATRREPKYLDEILRLLPSKVNAKGYLGPVFTDRIHEQQLSGNGWLLRGLCEHWLWKRDVASLAAVRRIARNLYLPLAGRFATYPIDPASRTTAKGGESGHVAGTSGEWALSSDIGCVFIGLDGLVQAWEVTKDDDLRPAIDELIAKFLAMDVIAIKAQTHATLTGLRALLRYAKAAGRRELVGEVQKRFELYRRYGMTENYENYNWFCAYDKWTETCAVVDSFMVAFQLWEATGRESYLELAHLIYWNGLSYLQRKNGGFGLDKTPGRGLGSPELRTHCSEAHWCCTMRGAEGLAAAAEYACVARGNEIVLAFPRSGTFAVSVAGKTVSLSCETVYPFAETGTVAFGSDLPAGVTVKVFVPFVGMQDLGGGHRSGAKIPFACPTPTHEEGLVNPDNALDGCTVRRFRGPLLLGADGRTVYHLMNPDVWHHDTGRIQVLQRKGN